MTLTPDRLEDPFTTFEVVTDEAIPHNTVVFRQEETSLPTTGTSEIVRWLEASEQQMLRELHQRQVEQILGTVTPVEVPEDIYRDIRVARQRIEEDHYHSPYGDRDWYCYCSPSRGQYYNRHREAQRALLRDQAIWELRDEAELRATYRRWEPTPVTMTPDELVHTCHPDANGVCVWADCPNAFGVAMPSKELAVIPKKELALREVIPVQSRQAEKSSLRPILAGVGCSVMAGVLGCLLFVLSALGIE